MTVEDTRFITGTLRAIRGDIAGLDHRMVNGEPRQSAMERRLVGIKTYLLALQHGIDPLGTDMRRVTQRLELVEE